MRNINLVKTANIISIFVIAAVMVMPFVASAQWVTPSAGNTGVPNQSSFSEIATRIIEILLAVAGLVAVVFLIVGGFRYITAGGNEETAESAKKTILNAIIGIVIVILAFVIVRVISNALISKTV
jgi:hypothetical protein